MSQLAAPPSPPAPAPPAPCVPVVVPPAPSVPLLALLTLLALLEVSLPVVAAATLATDDPPPPVSFTVKHVPCDFASAGASHAYIPAPPVPELLDTEPLDDGCWLEVE